MTCSKCGTELSATTRFCTQCGEQVASPNAGVSFASLEEVAVALRRSLAEYEARGGREGRRDVLESAAYSRYVDFGASDLRWPRPAGRWRIVLSDGQRRLRLTAEARQSWDRTVAAPMAGPPKCRGCGTISGEMDSFCSGCGAVIGRVANKFKVGPYGAAGFRSPNPLTSPIWWLEPGVSIEVRARRGVWVLVFKFTHGEGWIDGRLLDPPLV